MTDPYEDVDLQVHGRQIDDHIEKLARMESWKETNKSEVERILEEALEEARGSYDLDKLFNAVTSVSFLLRDDAGEIHDLPF